MANKKRDISFLRPTKSSTGKTPLDAFHHEGEKQKLEGKTGIKPVDEAIAKGLDPALTPSIFKQVEAAYTDDDLLKMVENGEIEIVDYKAAGTPFTPDNIERFLSGEITWAQLQGMTMEEAFALAEVGYTQFEQGRYDDAQSIFEGLVISNPYEGYFHTVLGAIYARKGMQEEAAEEYTVALELDPKNIAAHVNRAEILLQHGEFEAAMQDLQTAIKLDEKGQDPSGVRARALAGATAAIIDEVLKQRQQG